MVALLTISINHLSSPSPPLLSPAIIQSRATSFTSPPPHGCFSATVRKLPATETSCAHKSQFVLVDWKLSKPGFLQCSYIPVPPVSNSAVNSGVMLFPLFEELGISRKKAEVLLETHPKLRLTPFESIRARLQSLQSIGINGLSLSRLISKRPDFLTAKEIDSFVSFIQNDLKSKIEVKQLERLLRTLEPRFLLGFKRKVKFLVHCGIPKENLAHVLNKVNLTRALCLKSFAEIEKTMEFLNQFGGSDLILRRPAILNYDLQSQLIPRIGFLLGLSGGDRAATATVLRKLPNILAYSLEHLENHVNLLSSFGGLSNPEMFKIILVYPNLFSASRERKLKPRIDFLKKCGLSSDDISKFLIKAPLFVTLSFEENLAHKLAFLIKIGYKNRTRELALAMGAVTRISCSNMQEVISLFLNYGLTCEDIVAMGIKRPQVLQYNPVSLEQKMDYLLEDMGREVREVLAFPAFLGYKLDDRIKERYEVMREIRGEGMSINKLLSMSTARFSQKKTTIDDLRVGEDEALSA